LSSMTPHRLLDLEVEYATEAQTLLDACCRYHVRLMLDRDDSSSP